MLARYGAERRGNLMRSLHFVRNDDSFYDYLFKPFTIIFKIRVGKICSSEVI